MIFCSNHERRLAIEASILQGAHTGQLTLYRVSMVVFWRSLGLERQVNLESQRVASAQPTTR